MSEAVRVGVLYDFPQGDGGASFETALRLGIAEVGLDRPVELVSRHADGLPLGTAGAVEVAFAELSATDALAVMGPSISDNSLLVRDLADDAGVPCINYSGGEMTRSRWMFHYQVGSLAEEPVVLAEHAATSGYGRLAVVHDESPVGRGYIEALDAVAGRLHLDVAARAEVPPGAEDLSAIVAELRGGEPDALVYLGLGVAARAVSVAVSDGGWRVPVIANSALMFGYARKDWRAGWEGWVYVDTVADDNPTRARLAERSPASARGPVGVAAYDMGRLVAEGIARAGALTRDGVRAGLEQVKRLPAASGHAGTTMGFGCWDHGALKGPFLVLRTWRGGRTEQLEPIS